MQYIHQIFNSVLNIFHVVDGKGRRRPPPPWHDVGVRNALVTPGLITYRAELID